MTKILLLLLLIAVAVVWWQSVARRARREAPPPAPPPQRMVRCVECSVHLPESEAICVDGLHFCDEKHRAAYQRRFGA